MNALQVAGVFLSGLVAISALSLIVQPGSSFGGAISALGTAISTDISAAKK